MKFTNVVTAKIKPNIYTLIERGVKQWEVRDESFQNADVIRYVDAESGSVLGSYRLGEKFALPREWDSITRYLAEVDWSTFYELFAPADDGMGIDDGPEMLYAVQIGRQLDAPLDYSREASDE